MDIANVINRIQNYHKGGFDPLTSKDKVLYGDSTKECTGIVTSTWASVDVIKEAYEKGANLIISHEALFWNRGDYTDWLEASENKTFLEKKKLLDDTGIVVWRNHDFVHSGIPLENGTYVDGIFYGLFQELGWEKFHFTNGPVLATIEIPETSVAALAQTIMAKCHFAGARIYGDTTTLVKKIVIPYHVLGAARAEISYIEQENSDLVLAMEIVDFTLSEYIRDTNMLTKSKTMLTFGHFNLEEPGMKYMITYLPKAIGTDQIPCHFIQSGDMYHYLIG